MTVSLNNKLLHSSNENTAEPYFWLFPIGFLWELRTSAYHLLAGDLDPDANNYVPEPRRKRFKMKGNHVGILPERNIGYYFQDRRGVLLHKKSNLLPIQGTYYLDRGSTT